jgi:hypothetical protein
LKKIRKKLRKENNMETVTTIILLGIADVLFYFAGFQTCKLLSNRKKVLRDYTIIVNIDEDELKEKIAEIMEENKEEITKED